LLPSTLRGSQVDPDFCIRPSQRPTSQCVHGLKDETAG
jgi:hypothetical protein